MKKQVVLGCVALLAYAFCLPVMAGDRDADGIADEADNCTDIANPTQLDADGDGFGNACDGDFNNNGVVDSQDAALLKSVFGSTSSSASYADINGNGVVDSQDGTQVRVWFGQPPGPSAVGVIGGSIFPLHQEAGKRYLLDASGRPFLINGDTAWLLMVQLNEADAEQYLEDRRQRKVNAILVELIEHYYADDPPRNRAGDAPFTTPGDFSTPNPAYFDHVARIIDKAASKGILVLSTPAYMGYDGGSQGWYQDMTQNGVTKLHEYGRFLGQRFAGKDNILWVQGGDFNPPESPGLELTNAIVDGISDGNPTARWLHTFHADRGRSARNSIVRDEPWLKVNNIYTGDTDIVSEAFTAYNDSSLPFFLIEGRYETGSPGDGQDIRRQAYQALLSGASGHLIGNESIWRFGTDWQTDLNSQGADSLPTIAKLLGSQNWWLLVPDLGNTFLTEGVQNGSYRAVAALASDSQSGLIYMPTIRPVTVNLGALGGPRVQARWYDPVTGSYTAIAGSPFDAIGTRQFTPVGNNAQGDGDWVLVLEATN